MCNKRILSRHRIYGKSDLASFEYCYDWRTDMMLKIAVFIWLILLFTSSTIAFAWKNDVLLIVLPLTLRSKMAPKNWLFVSGRQNPIIYSISYFVVYGSILFRVYIIRISVLVGTSTVLILKSLAHFWWVCRTKLIWIFKK